MGRETYHAPPMHDALHALHAEFARGEAQRRAGAVAQAPGAGERGAGILPADGQVHYLPWADGGDPVALVPASYGSVEVEYAALRRGCALLDGCARGIIRVRGKDRLDVLQRMLTQDLRGLESGGVRRSFWLNRKGRIDADLSVVAFDDHWLLECDALDAPGAATSLSSFIFNEDIELVHDATLRVLSLAGPSTFEALTAVGADTGVLAPSDARSCMAHVAGIPCHAWRLDWFGVPTVHLACAAERAAELWKALLAQVDLAHGRRRVRPCGWYAQNIARIEAGEPWCHVDFGRESLPHESGVLRERVSFTKGCYLGQEIVARMESLGKPKQVVAALRIVRDALPSAGEQIFSLTEGGGLAEQVGAVTSSTLSPMLGAVSIALATVRTAHAAPGTILAVNAEGMTARAVVQPTLRFVGATP
ncbi:MAG: Aminomethyltransferase [Planctomycetota bacterium]